MFDVLPGGVAMRELASRYRILIPRNANIEQQLRWKGQNKTLHNSALGSARKNSLPPFLTNSIT
jgi:hypothetical protein